MSYVVRKGGLASLYLQNNGSWGGYKTARRFKSQDKADAAGSEKTKDYGVFPVSPRRSS